MDKICDECGEPLESTEHVFRFCVLSKLVWQQGLLSIDSDSNKDVPITDWVSNYIQLFYSMDGIKSDRLIYFVITLWELWMARNNRIHKTRVSIIIKSYYRSLIQWKYTGSF